MGRPTNESKEIAELVAGGMTQEDAEKLTADERAVLLAPPEDEAENAKRAEKEAELEALRAAAAEAAELRAQLAARESELVAATADATNARTENEALRGHLANLSSEFGEGERADRPGEIRLKGPMLIHFVPPTDYEPAEDGPIPASYPLTKGLNVDVPAWVLNTFVVQANREED